MTSPEDPFAAPTPGEQPSPAPAPYGGPPPPPYGSPAQPPYGAPVHGSPFGSARNGLGVAALVLGILSLPLTMMLVPAVLAVIFGVIGRQRARRGEATNGGVALAGLITGTIGLLLGVLLWGVGIAAFTSPAGHRWRDCMDRAAGSSAANDACTRTFMKDYFGIDTTSH
jgi:hypothetical protein